MPEPGAPASSTDDGPYRAILTIRPVAEHNEAQVRHYLMFMSRPPKNIVVLRQELVDFTFIVTLEGGRSDIFVLKSRIQTGFPDLEVNLEAEDV